MQEWFLNVADGADPDTDIWNVTETNDAAVTVDVYDSIGFLKVLTGTADGNTAIVDTKDILAWNVNKTDGAISELHMKNIFRIIDLTGEVGFGLSAVSSPSNAENWDSPGGYVASIHVDNDTVNFCSSDGTTTEKTNAISWISTNNTWYTAEIIVTATSVKFYIDGTLRATHSTNVPAYVQKFGVSARNTNSITSEIDVQYVHVWTE